MAEERLNIQYLVNLLADKHGLDKQSTEVFIKEFFLLVEEGLEKDKIVKIKGFGTFKITEVKSRESINVNTGERFEIQGHNKVSFTPDASLRDIINKPFSHFETIILKDGVHFDNELETDDLSLVEDENDVEDDITNEETIENDIVVEREDNNVFVAADTADEESIVDENTELQPEESAAQVLQNIDEPISEESEKSSQEDTGTQDILIEETPEETSVDDNEIESVSKLPLDEIIARELQDSNRLFNKSIDGDVSASDIGEPVPSRPSKGFIVTTIIVTILVCGTAVLYTYFPNFIDDIFNRKKDATEITQNNLLEVNPVTEMPVATDTVEQTVLAEDTIGKVVVKKEEPVIAVPEKQKPTVTRSTPAITATETERTKKPVQTTSSTSGTVAKKTDPIMSDNSPVRPDSTSYNIIGTKTSYTIQSGETLTRVALRFYGTKDLWPYIVMHNRKKIPDPQVVPAGLTIQIPELEKK